MKTKAPEATWALRRFELALRHRDWSIKLLRAENKLLRLKLQEPSKVTF